MSLMLHWQAVTVHEGKRVRAATSFVRSTNKGNRNTEMDMTHRLTLTVSYLALLVLAACTPSSSPDSVGSVEPDSRTLAEEQLHELFADEWTKRLRQNPLFASRMGVADYNDQLPDMSPEAQKRNLDNDLGYLDRLEHIDRSQLSEDDQENADLFEFVLGHRATLAKYRQYRIPILSDSGFHISVQRMYESMTFSTPEDYEVYLQRLRALDPYFEQNIQNMRTGIAEGFTQPRVILEGIVPSIAGPIVEQPEKYFFHAVSSHAGAFQRGRCRAFTGRSRERNR